MCVRVGVYRSSPSEKGRTEKEKGRAEKEKGRAEKEKEKEKSKKSERKQERKKARERERERDRERASAPVSMVSCSTHTPWGPHVPSHDCVSATLGAPVSAAFGPFIVRVILSLACDIHEK